MNTAFKIILFTVAALVVLKSCVPYLGFENPLLGEPVPEVTLTNLDEQEVPLSAVRSGKPALIFFWATWCPHCRARIQELAAYRQAIENRGATIILINVGERPAKVRNFMVTQKLPFDMYLDEDRTISKQFHLIGVPTFFFLNQAGKILAVENNLPESYTEILLSPSGL